MRRPGLRGLAGAAIAAAAFAAAMTFPARVGEGPRPLAPSERAALACFTTSCEPGLEELAERVDGQLTARMPFVEDGVRRILAATIIAEARAARIDPLLVLALIEVESSFDPGALSGRGARGLMQLRERTMHRELQRSGVALEDPHDPIANVQAGVRYLRRLLDAFGREEVALMAYNAGPNRILGYLREGAIPERFHLYPRRVNAEVRRLRRSIGAEPAPMVAEAERARAALD